MFDIGWPELMLIMVVALIVIGPKELPGTIRTVVGLVRKARSMAADFQSGLSDLAREAGVNEIKQSIEEEVSYDPKAALDSLAGIDDGEFSMDGGAQSGPANSIHDPGQSANRATAANEDKPAPRPATPAAHND